MRMSRGSNTFLLALVTLLILGALGAPALAAGQNNQFIRAFGHFEGPNLKCSNGTFKATGTFQATGRQRSCVQSFEDYPVVTGRTQLHNGDDPHGPLDHRV